MSDEVLRPCPICGKKVSIARTDNEVGERWWFITRGTYRTTRCNCRLFLESEKFTCGWNDDYSLECRAKLIDKWNTRAELGSESVDYMLNTIGKLEEENERLRSSCGTLTAEQVRKCVRVGACDHGLWWALDEDTDWQAIADELNAERGSDDGYESKMDALLSRLTGGKWSKSRTYDLDFMVSCVDEEYEELYEKERAELESGTCELVYGENDYGDDGWWCQSCGEWFAASFRHTGRNNIIKPSYCQHCGKSVKR